MEHTPKLYSGGYFLTRPIHKPDYLANESGETLPATILSACSCGIGTPGIVPWAGGNPSRLGVEESRFPELEEWSKTAFGQSFGFPDVFYNLDEAWKYVQKFIIEPPEDIVILCPALPSEIAEDFLKTEKKSPERGVYQVLEKRDAPAKGGLILGYEPLCYYYDLDHSWLCNSLHEDAYKRWKITPNSNGFLDKFDDAKRVTDLALEVGAEDGLWLPWLIIQYPVIAT